MKFAQSLGEPTFAVRAALGSVDGGVKDAQTLARALLAMSQAEFSAAFKGSPMKRAKRRGLARNAAVALGNVGTADDVPVLEAALAHDEPLLREHAAWALERPSARRPEEPAPPSRPRPRNSSFPGMANRRATVTIRHLNDEPDSGLSEAGTAAERVALVETLTAEAWALAGRDVPAYARADAPVRVATPRAATSAVHERPYTSGRTADALVNPDFVDFLEALLAVEARFLVVGAHALAVHGVPRATGDIGVWIDRSPPNVVLVWRAMENFGVPAAALGVRPADLETPDTVVQIGLPPRRIDVLTGVTGLTFDNAWGSRVVHRIGALDVPFLGRDALVRNKRATGRYKDLGDLEALGEDPQAEG